MKDDRELLRRFAEEGSDKAFAEFVERNGDLVHRVAMRVVDRNQQLAAEVPVLRTPVPLNDGRPRVSRLPGARATYP